MHVLRENKDSVMAVLEAFVYDPLLNWRLMDGALSALALAYVYCCLENAFSAAWKMYIFHWIVRTVIPGFWLICSVYNYVLCMIIYHIPLRDCLH